MKLREIAAALALPLEGDGGLEITGLSGLADARVGELAFVSGPRYGGLLAASKASAVLAPPGLDVGGRSCLRSGAPYADFARAIELLYPRARPGAGVHPTASLGADVRLGPDVSIGAYTVVGAGTRIGARSRLHSGITIYTGVEIGEDCEIHSGVHLRDGVRIGNRVTIHNTAVIGGEGFGFATDAAGYSVRVPHRCAVRIGDDCEIGAGTTIDASHHGHPRHGHEDVATRIGDRVKIDNQVHIGHGCEIGSGSTLCAQTALAGSTVVGRNVFMGGNSATAGHLRIGDGCLVGARCGVSGDLEPGSQVLGTPHMERKQWTRFSVARKRLPELLKRVRRIESRLGMTGED